MSDVATGSAEATKSFFGRIYRFGETHGLGVLAHTVFGAAALYFAYLFFEFELSLAFVRNLGVAVTFWASLGLAFNFATINARTAESSFAGWNVIILGTSELLCLVAMANHKNLLLHTIVVHLVLTLSALWNMLARHYYKSRSRAWNEWYEERFTEDALWWVVYLFAAYLPFYLPPLGIGLSAQSVADASDGATAVVLFFEFFSFWWNTWKQRRVLAKYSTEVALATEPLPHEDILARILSTPMMRVGCLYWPPVVDCTLIGGLSRGGSNHEPAFTVSGLTLSRA